MRPCFQFFVYNPPKPNFFLVTIKLFSTSGFIILHFHQHCTRVPVSLPTLVILFSGFFFFFFFFSGFFFFFFFFGGGVNSSHLMDVKWSVVYFYFLFIDDRTEGLTIITYQTWDLNRSKLTHFFFLSFFRVALEAYEGSRARG